MKRALLVSVIFGTLLLSGCDQGSGAPASTATAAATATVAPTGTPVPPTATATEVPPTATPTESPSPTATTTPTRDPLLVLADDFAGTCALPEGDNDQRTFNCEGGEYTMLSKLESSRWVYYREQDADYVLEADAHAFDGPAFVEYGVVFRVSSDGKSFYGFTLTRDGRYTVFRYQNDFFDLVPYTASSAIQKDTATNHLRVVVRGNQIALSVNGQLLRTVQDAKLARGSFGFFINHKEPNAKAGFDNLRVTRLVGPDVVPTRPAGTPPRLNPVNTPTRVPPSITPTRIPTRTTPVATPIPGSPIPPGKSGLLVLNYFGEMVTLTINDQEHKLLPQTAPGVPSERVIILNPGRYTYSANTPSGREKSGELILEANKGYVVNLIP